MTESATRSDYGIETPGHILRRFDIDVIEINTGKRTAQMSMSLRDLTNPFTGLPAMGPLAILVDAVGGLVNHFWHEAHEWTVSSELAIELSPDASERATAPEAPPVLAVAKTLGPRSSTSLSLCELRCGQAVIGSATVRSYFIPPDNVVLEELRDDLTKTERTGLADLMAVEPVARSDQMRVLRQRRDAFLDNAIGVVNGGVASAALELVASAAMHRPGIPMWTSSLRVNFLRPFLSGAASRYEGSPVRLGRGSAVCDARAVGDDGKTSLTARVTAYR